MLPPGILLLLLGASLGSADPAKRRLDPRPNFIIMLMDDVSCYLELWTVVVCPHVYLYLVAVPRFASSGSA